MPRSESTIATDMTNQMLAADASVDVKQGPFFDLAIRPVATELSYVEAATARLSTLYSRLADNPLSLTSSEVVALGKNFRVAMPQGKKAAALVTFYWTTVPANEIVIPAGTPVASSDGVYVFTTNTEISGITSSNAAAYYNAATGRYTAQVQATAMSIGSGYNLSAYRITKMMTSISGVAGVYNVLPSQGGSSPDTSINYLTEIQANFFSRDTSSLGGLVIDLQRRGLVQQPLLVTSAERASFTRPVSKPGVDVYLMMAEDTLTEDQFIASTANKYQLSRQPVQAVLSVYVNNVLLDTALWSFSADTSRAYQNSCLATSYVQVSKALNTSDIVRISYTYSGSCWNLYQSIVQSDILGADVLIRLTNPYYVTMQAEILAASSLISDVQSAIDGYMITTFLTKLSIDNVNSYLYDAFPDLKSIRWTTFCKYKDVGTYAITIPKGFSPMFKTSADLRITSASV